MSNKRLKTKDQQKGSALVLAMFITTAILSLVGLSTLSNESTTSIVKKNSMQFARDELAKTLVSFITNPQVIKKQARYKNRQYSYGHTLLYNCLNGSEKDVGGVACEHTSEVTTAADGYYNLSQLTLLPPDDFQYPEAKVDRAPNEDQVKNCPEGNVAHPSCLLSGKNKADEIVGLNLQGETGQLSPCFPFEPVVYINPYCRDEFGDEAENCDIAEDIEFVYQIIHRPDEYFGQNAECPLNQGKKQFNLGTFPKKPEVVSLPRHALVDYECNTGAFIKVYESDGSVICECRFPFTPIPGKSNEKGALCQDALERCPGGTVLVSRDSDGNAVCKNLNELSAADEKPPLYVSTDSVSNPPRGQPIRCDNKGWVQNVQMECTGQATTREDPGTGHSCLFFYEFVKLIDNGGTMIPGPIPATFYKDDASLPCNAHQEKIVTKPPSNGYDALCFGTILGLVAAGAAGTGAILKKATSKVISKASAKVVGKAAAKTAAKKATTKSLTKWVGKKAAQRTAQKAATEAAEKAARDKAAELAAKGIAADLVVKGAREAAEEAAAKAAKETMEKFIVEAAEEADEQAAKAVSDHLEKQAIKKATTQTTKQGIEDAIEKGASDALGKELASRHILKGQFRTTGAKAREAAQNKIARATAAKAAKENGKTALKKTAIAGAAYSGGFAGIVLGDLSPEIFTAALALGFAIDGAGVAVNAIRGIPFVGFALAVLAALAFALTFSSIQVEVDYNCYPLDTEPQITCKLTGTCFHYGQDFTRP